MDAWEERAASERGFKRKFPQNVDEDVEACESRALSTDDDPDRVKCWKRVAWTTDAKEYMPGWMAERYSDHFDESSDQSEQAGEKENTLPLSPSDVSTEHMTDTGRLPAIEATVTGKHTDRYGNPAGHLRGDAGGIDYTAVSLEADELPAGATVRVVNAKLTKTDLGALELEIDPTTEIVVEDTNDTDNSTGNDTATATDGGDGVAETEENAGIEDERLDRVIRNFRGYSKDEFTKPEAIAQAAQFSDGNDHAERLIEAAVDRGEFEWADGDDVWMRVL
jgi:hypothetical protein